MTLTNRVREWQREGERVEFRGRSIHVRSSDGPDPVLLLLHGFPSSSYDWRAVLGSGLGHATLSFDCLGFGLSEKPRDHTYSLFWQADLAEELVRSRFAGRPVFIVAHDMGTSVATELLARDVDGELEMRLAGVLLFNGSIVLDRASPTIGQRLLRGPVGPLASRLTNERTFRQQLGSVFSAEHPLSADEASDQWALVCHNGGRTMGHRTIAYMDERIEHAGRWHGAIRDWPGPLSFVWGLKDPVATTAVLAALRELRPYAPVTELPELGHYPQLEDPQSITAAILAAVDQAKDSAE